MTIRLRRAALAILAAVAAVLALGVGTASAHVSVGSPNAAAGGFAELTFSVPNESDTASTTGLRVQLPTDTPLAFVSVKPVPGWTAVTTTTTLDPAIESHGTTITEAVSEITWTADPGVGIRPGEYQTFSISAGPLPDAESLTLPAIQTYDDGTEAAWIEPTVDGQPEPERPAPVLALAGESAGGEAEGGTVAEASAGSDAAASDDSGGSGLAVTALVVGALGLVAGVAGLGIGLAARRRAG
ncbi:YcnI family protein [Geodermatophilus sp. SYSU D00815]